MKDEHLFYLNQPHAAILFSLRWLCQSPTNNIHETNHACLWIRLNICLPPHIIQNVSTLFHQIHDIRHRQGVQPNKLLAEPQSTRLKLAKQICKERINIVKYKTYFYFANLIVNWSVYLMHAHLLYWFELLYKMCSPFFNTLLLCQVRNINPILELINGIQDSWKTCKTDHILWTLGWILVSKDSSKCFFLVKI